MTTDAVNARLGPGTGYDVAFTLGPDLPLVLIRQENGWGLFEYPAQGGETGQIWIFMDLVRQKRS